MGIVKFSLFVDTSYIAIAIMYNKRNHLKWNKVYGISNNNMSY